MGRKLALGVLIIIVVAAAGIYMQYGYSRGPVDEEGVRLIIRDRYSIEDLDGLVHQEGCTVCDEGGCRVLEECWIANFTLNQTTHGVVIDGGSGEVVQESQAPCTEWWCTGTPCTYYYVEIIPNGTRSHYNTGCVPEEPACDQDHERCRACSSPVECIRTTITDTGVKDYLYEMVGEDSWGGINDTSLYCRIFDEGAEVFYNQTTVEQCRDVVLQWTRCGNGICDFKPDFGMIPY